MADETTDDKCLACEIVWYALIGLGVAAVAFMAADIFTQGQATEWAAGLFSKVKPLASVTPIREGDGDGERGAG